GARGGRGAGVPAGGAGGRGLIGAAAVFALAIVFFVAESYFLAMLLVSFAMLVYVAGGELGRLLKSAFTVFFSGRHLIKNAQYLQDTVTALRKFLDIKREASGAMNAGPIEPGPGS